MYRDKDLLEGAIPHLLYVDKKNRASLRAVLYKFRDVLPNTLPTRAPPNWKLGYLYEIPLEKGAKPVWKSMY